MPTPAPMPLTPLAPLVARTLVLTLPFQMPPQDRVGQARHACAHLQGPMWQSSTSNAHKGCNSLLRGLSRTAAAAAEIRRHEYAHGLKQHTRLSRNATSATGTQYVVPSLTMRLQSASCCGSRMHNEPFQIRTPPLLTFRNGAAKNDAKKILASQTARTDAATTQSLVPVLARALGTSKQPRACAQG